MVPVKLIFTWDIAPDREQDYFEFMVREFIPGVQRLGFELTDAWATVYGSQPQIMVGVVLPSISKARQVMRTSEWNSLYNKLLDHVVNFSSKIVEARRGFQF
ncbi:MAG TPA: hypothetical protein PLS77_08135 [Anaerolineaceae bacterium]|jgi:hypothetical protein|nr:hypothetical protein [Anaerolineaceae bacterium]NMD31889.1 hypothetical protein [Chloroflexota bacterium]HNS63656.1 hypothetical protein [Anaerolineaceae bacterium]HNZ01114.1 hypothetical protein [Anaerolineaceae bacterium]HOD44413.1 hypothetical protein [Anaerolineaceae bacterium]